MLRIVSLFLLLIISRVSFADTIPATPTISSSYSISAANLSGYSSSSEICSAAFASFSGFFPEFTAISIYNSTDSRCTIEYKQPPALYSMYYNYSVVFSDETKYSCLSGYTQSDSSGNPASSGAFCTKPDKPADKTCAELAADGSYELGSGYFVAGHSSTYCYQANPTHICQISNNGESIYFGKISDTCSVGMGGGSYWSYTGSDCTSVGPSVNYYKTSQAASLACNPTLPDGASSAVSTAPDTSDSPPSCPGGSGSITNGSETMTVCLDAPVTTTPSSSTPTTDNSSGGSDSPSTDNSTTNNDNSTTNNNTTNTSNSSSSTTNTTTNNDNSTTNNDNSTTTTNNDNSTTNTSGGSSSGSSGSSSGTGGSGSATSGASGTGGSGTATSGASGTGGDGDSVSGAESTCPEGDDSLSCATLGTAPESEALKPTEVNFGYTPDAAWWGGSGSGSGGSGGSCVADYKVSSDISVSYEPLCKTLTSVRPVLLGVCFLISATILFGFRRNGGDD